MNKLRIANIIFLLGVILISLFISQVFLFSENFTENITDATVAPSTDNTATTPPISPTTTQTPQTNTVSVPIAQIGSGVPKEVIDNVNSVIYAPQPNNLQSYNQIGTSTK